MIRFVEFRDIKVGGALLYAVDALNSFVRRNNFNAEILQVHHQPGSILLQIDANEELELNAPNGALRACAHGLHDL